MTTEDIQAQSAAEVDKLLGEIAGDPVAVKSVGPVEEAHSAPERAGEPLQDAGDQENQEDASSGLSAAPVPDTDDLPGPESVSASVLDRGQALIEKLHALQDERPWRAELVAGLTLFLVGVENPIKARTMFAVIAEKIDDPDDAMILADLLASKRRRPPLSPGSIDKEQHLKERYLRIFATAARRRTEPVSGIERVRAAGRAFLAQSRDNPQQSAAFLIDDVKHLQTAIAMTRGARPPQGDDDPDEDSTDGGLEENNTGAEPIVPIEHDDFPLDF